jgi:hypothetical protein
LSQIGHLYLGDPNSQLLLFTFPPNLQEHQRIFYLNLVSSPAQDGWILDPNPFFVGTIGWEIPNPKPNAPKVSRVISFELDFLFPIHDTKDAKKPIN